MKGPKCYFLAARHLREKKKIRTPRGLLAAKALSMENNYTSRKPTHMSLTISTRREPSLRRPPCATSRLSIRWINHQLVSWPLSAHVTHVHQHRGSCHTTLTINYRNQPLNPHVAVETVLKPRNDRQREGKHFFSYGADEEFFIDFVPALDFIRERLQRVEPGNRKRHRA